MTDEPVAPERATIHPAFALPVIFVTVVFIAGWLYAFAGAAVFSPWWLAVAGPMLAVLGGAAARAHWDEADYGTTHTRQGVWLARVAGMGAGVWLAWSGWATPGAALPLLALGALPLWAWFGILSWQAPKKAVVMAERYEQGHKIAQERGWRTILDRAGSDDVIITETREHRAGMVLTVEPDPDAKKAPTYDEFSGRAGAIATEAAMHYRRTQNIRLPRSAVRPEPGRDDAEFLLHVTMRDVFRESTKYIPDYVPGDIVNALDLGEFEDAARLLIVMAGHLKIVGATGSGKSNLANNLIGRITGCANALVWVAATDKLVPLVWPWLRCFFEGKTARPLLDYVAGQDSWSVLCMLRAAYRLASERNARLDDESKMRPTSDEPAVFVFVEEVSHGVEFTDTIETHDGQEVTISDLLKMIGQAGRSANVWLVLMSQYGINAALGERASELIRNLTMRICLRTMESHDGYRTVPGLPATVDTSKLSDFTMYVQPSTDEPRAFPAKAPELDGAEQVEPVAIGNTRWRPAGVEAASELGPDYDTRWDEDRLPILAARLRTRGWAWPQDRGGVAVADPIGPPPATVGGPDDGGHDVDTAGWTDADDAKWRSLLDQRDDGSAAEREPEQRPGKAFEVPDFSDDMARLDALAEAMGTPVNPGAGAPVPEPLRSVVEWLDRSEADRSGWVITADIADGIGWSGDPVSLGRKLNGLRGIESKNAPRSADPAQRRGYPVRMLREAAERYRYGMP